MHDVRPDREDEATSLISIEILDLDFFLTTRLRSPQPVHPINNPHGWTMHHYRRKSVFRLGQPANMFPTFTRTSRRIGGDQGAERDHCYGQVL
jgi:hypothetical protein